ncbi:MAG: membrane protein insertion efficiency factor YidD [Bacilli bacterium]|nr:membrane protein insertion efficiency factor YidD [Bacilli bacterium]
MKYVLIWLIKIYQKIPGPWHEICKHQPTCSNYAIGVIKEFGFFKGSFFAIKRILKCNPWDKGGYDPIPCSKKKKDGGINI